MRTYAGEVASVVAASGLLLLGSTGSFALQEGRQLDVGIKTQPTCEEQHIYMRSPSDMLAWCCPIQCRC